MNNAAEILPWVNLILNILIVPALTMLSRIMAQLAAQAEIQKALADRLSLLERKVHGV